MDMNPSKSFMFEGKQYLYPREGYNLIAERIVELPIAFDVLLDAYGKGHRVLEVGYVTPMYPHLFKAHHEVLDKLDLRADRVMDLLTYRPEFKYGTIVSISTIEHMGHNVEPYWNYGEPEDPTRALTALEHIRNLVTSMRGSAVVTFPLGFNPALDNELKNNGIQPGSLHRVSSLWETKFLKRTSITTWAQCLYEDCMDAKFDSPYPCGNAICVARWRNTRT
jgi:hypothetical protein